MVTMRWKCNPSSLAVAAGARAGEPKKLLIQILGVTNQPEVGIRYLRSRGSVQFAELGSGDAASAC